MFLSEPGQLGFYLALVLFFLEVIIIGATRLKRAPPKKAELTKSQKASSLINGLVIIFALLITPFFGYAGVAPLPDWAYYVGLSLLILGLTIAPWAQRTLGRNYSPHALVYQGHQLVQRGPYRFVRHPIYTAGFLLVVGWGMMAQSWAAVVLTAIAAGIGTTYRIRVEEKVLLSEFGEQYKSYSKRVKRLIPFIL